eukprot:XP_011603277.1 PREDICTED: ribosome-recycling factor, mitochondrial [Takifugu rubripes]
MALSRLNLLRPLLLRQLRCPLVVTSRLQQPPPLPACGLRLYATKKAKAKAKGQSAKLNINAALVEDIVDLGALRAEMAAVVSALKDDFTRSLSIRTSLGNPPVTREHRENLAKVAKQLANKAKESLRRVRSGAVTQAKRTKEGHSEDTVRLVEKQIQQLSDNTAAEVDKLLAAKTKELLG